MNLTIIVNDSAYGIEKPWNALRLASTAATELEMGVKVFLMGDSVVAAKRGQKTPNGYYNMEKMLRALIKRGVEMKVCGNCIKIRGLDPSELVEGVEEGSMKILAEWIRDSDRVVSF